MRLNTLARIAALACASAAVPAFAQSSVQVYGTIDVAVGDIEQQAGGPSWTGAITRVRGVHNGGLQTSFWGLRGTEDLGDGLKARFQLESFFRADTGALGRFDATATAGADLQWSRIAFVALGSNTLGEVKLGNTPNPTWVSMLQTSAMSGNSVFSPNFRTLYNGGARGRSEVDTALVNSVQYSTPIFAGLSSNVAVQAGEGSGHKYSYNANIIYRNGPIVATAAVQKVNHAATPNLAADRDQQTALFGFAYDFGVVRVFAQYVDIDNDRTLQDDKVPSLGVTVPLFGGQLQLAGLRDKITARAAAAPPFNNVNVERTVFSAGYVYPLSKRTELYTMLMQDKTKTKNLANTVTLFDGTADSYVAGIRHQF